MLEDACGEIVSCKLVTEDVPGKLAGEESVGSTVDVDEMASTVV